MSILCVTGFTFKVWISISETYPDPFWTHAAVYRGLTSLSVLEDNVRPGLQR